MISSHKWWCDSRRRRRESDERSHEQCEFVYIISTTGVDDIQMFRNFSIFFLPSGVCAQQFLFLCIATRTHIARRHTLVSNLGIRMSYFSLRAIVTTHSDRLWQIQRKPYLGQHQLNYFLFHSLIEIHLMSADPTRHHTTQRYLSIQLKCSQVVMYVVCVGNCNQPTCKR